jgi:type II secretory pathway pseudopilin PulG
MTLIEVLIAMVVAVILLQVTMAFFIGQSRLVGENESRRSSRDVTRTAMNVFMTDLRRVETGNGVVDASGSAIDLRVPFAIGVVCGNDVISVLPTDAVRLQAATVTGFGYAVRANTAATGGYGAVADAPAAQATVVDKAECNPLTVAVPEHGLALEIPGVDATSGAAPGALIMMYERISYRFAEEDGQRFLERSINGASWERLVGPFDATDTAFRFYYSNDTESTDNEPNTLLERQSIRGIELVLVGVGDRPRPGSTEPAHAPLTTAVFFKNRTT